MKEAESRPFGKIKRGFADSFSKTLSIRYFRAATLLMNIDSDAAREATAAIRTNAPSKFIRDVFRATTLQIHGAAE